ncbi:helix-turn-helix domain-containing protein [Flammeovirga sp. MY04]|uniref:helix-turn-helix domain-containing protein n=1 Tax=Flammeovirga sp. MY04 TaxID=1191459 RepID=UPI0008061F64|nr:AraC family transcriptional regulator [Flammeovirga sp. MY04]ANQ50401.1 helix-turn-helix domain-containing protein [Flammeovirga sp. MY04]
MESEIKKYKIKETPNGEFEIIDLEYLMNNKFDMITTPHRAGFYHVLWIEEGYGTHYIDFKPIKVEKNSLIFIDIESVNLYDKEGDYKGKSLIFTDNFFCQSVLDFKYIKSSILFNDLYGIAKIAPIHFEEELKVIFDQITEESKFRQDESHQMMLQKLVHLFLLQSERALRKQGVKELAPSPALTIVNNFRELLEEYYKKEKSVKWYSGQLNLSEKQLHKATKEILGKTPKNVIDKRVVLEAKRLLSHTIQPVKEIAYDLGYDEPTNFVKYFKRHTGTTPLDFRGQF